MSFHPLSSRLRIFEHLRRLEPVSRTQLCQSTGLANATVSEVVRDLLDSGFLCEERDAASGRGRPRILLKTDPDRLVLAGAFLQVANNRLEVRITNLLGEDLATEVKMLPRGFDALDLVEAIVDGLNILKKQAPVGAVQPAALSVSLPGIVDAHRGVLHWLPPLAPASFPIGQMLTEKTGLPVFVDNVCNAIARGERWFGSAGFQDDLCVILVGAGIGLAQYVSGSLHRGAHGLNAEFGHVKTGVGINETCLCGGNGCLVQSAGLVAIAEKVNVIFGQTFDPLSEFEQAFDFVAALAQSGRHEARLLLDRAGEALGIALANHIMTWDPSRILVIAANKTWEEAVGAKLKEVVAANLPSPDLYSIRIEFQQEDVEVTRKSSAALGLDGMMYQADLDVWQ